MRVLMIAIAVLWLGYRSAFAQQSAPNVQAAQSFFASGNTAYNLGRFDAAADLFSKAYEAWPQLDFLYNIAQSYRAGRNCKQALHFYKRFRSLKEQDAAAPLSQKKKDEIEKFISELTECVANAERSAVSQPDTIVKPQLMTTAPPMTTTTTGTMTTTTTRNSTAPTTTNAPSGKKGPTAALEPKNQEGEDDAVTKERPSTGPRRVVARLTGGMALISAGDLDIPIQPMFGLIGGYPIHIAPVTIEVGAALSYTPLPYAVMDEQKRGMMLGFRATAVASYPVMPKLSLRGDLGFGIVSLSGLEAGNPISTNHEADSFMLPSIRLGVAADYELAPNLAATISPLSLAFSPGGDRMYASSLREIDVVVGIGYRQ
jgi:hypothetical protein